LRRKGNSRDSAAPSSPGAAINAFVTGKVSYDALVPLMRGWSESGTYAALDIRGAINAAVEEGRLPFDLAGILLGQFPVARETATGDTEESLDEETLPYALTSSPDDNTRTAPLGDHILDRSAEKGPSPDTSLIPPLPPEATRPETEQPPLPPLPPANSTSPDAELPAYDEIRSKVDDVVLSALIGEFQGLRKPRDGNAGPPARDKRTDALDGLLTNYKSARFRSDARRAAQGGGSQGLNLRRRDDFGRTRAGVGSILRDRFILDSEIGRGGMGIVFKAVDRRRLEAGSDQPYVALKLLNDDFRTNAYALQVLEAEARKAQSLAHPNVATVYDFDRDRAEIFIVMELLTGKPLSRVLSNAVGQGLPGQQVATVLRGTCSAMSYAHQRGVIHSDLKPGNIFVTDDGSVKLIDFGLAAATLAGGFDVSELGGLTEPYASPEMFQDAPRDPRDDIFALGCIAYQLLTGTHPFGMKPSSEAAERNLQPAPVPDLDPTAWVAILQALNFDRDARTKTVDDFYHGIFEA